MERNKKEPIEVDFTDKIKSMKETKARKDEHISEKDLVKSIAMDVNSIRKVVENYGEGEVKKVIVDDTLDQSLVDSINNYIFTSKEEAQARASLIGFRAVHAYKTHDGVVLFMPGRNTGEFYDWFWKTHSE